MSPKKNAAAVALGRKGGKARAQNLTKEQLSEIGRKAIAARWAKEKAELRELADENTEGTKRLEHKFATRKGKKT